MVYVKFILDRQVEMRFMKSKIGCFLWWKLILVCDHCCLPFDIYIMTVPVLYKLGIYWPSECITLIWTRKRKSKLRTNETGWCDNLMAMSLWNHGQWYCRTAAAAVHVEKGPLDHWKSQTGLAEIICAFRMRTRVVGARSVQENITIAGLETEPVGM